SFRAATAVVQSRSGIGYHPEPFIVRAEVLSCSCKINLYHEPIRVHLWKLVSLCVDWNFQHGSTQISSDGRRSGRNSYESRYRR
ncbi:MAG: hypothetical protein AAGH89_16075, partial [Verrucomicrobiota bacterium]